MSGDGPEDIVLTADEDSALTAWGVGEHYATWSQDRRLQLVWLAERFRQKRTEWSWHDAEVLCNGLAPALERAEPLERLRAAVDRLAARAFVINVASVDGFVEAACRPRSPRRGRR